MYYFVSDTHLGAGGNGSNAGNGGNGNAGNSGNGNAGNGTTKRSAREVERAFVKWLREVGKDAQGIFLCGDIFDFWFEYQYVVPKGFVRVLAEIAALTDRGVRVVFMAGNHDMWVGNYLSEECGVEMYTAPRVFELNGRRVHVAHGDNLNVKSDFKLKLLNKIFRSETLRTLFSTFIHPDVALRFGLWWSNSSRKKHGQFEGHNTAEGRDVPPLIKYAMTKQEQSPCDYYIYGHLHQCFSHRETDSNGKEYEILFMNDWDDKPHYISLNKEGVMQINQVNELF